MAIHLSPFRLYKGRICLNHGILVEILRCTYNFWNAYRMLLDLNGVRDSKVRELKKIMDKMGLKHKKVSDKRKIKVVKDVLKDFSEGFSHIDNMLKSLEKIIRNDETFLFRAVKELKRLYLRFRKSRNPAMPEHLSYSIQHRFYSLISHMAETQHHAWVVSKAHSRDFIKLSELTIVSSRAERRRIRRQTLELDHLRNRIEPLKAKLSRLDKVRTQQQINTLHEEVDELLRLYHKEISDISHILHEADVLIRRTEKLFKALEHEAKQLGLPGLDKSVKKYSLRFKKLLKKIEDQARREFMDIKIMIKKLPVPSFEHGVVKDIHSQREKKRKPTQEELAKAA
jgi:septation ring formation regulator EzrA